MPGPAPTPSYLKILNGNPGKRPINENEPQPERKLPPCPDYLSETAKKRWMELGNHLLELGVMTVIDGDALANICSLHAWIVRLETEIETDKADVQLKHTIDAAGNEFLEMKSNPRVNLLKDFYKLHRGYLSDFGMTPASRSKIGVIVKTDIKSKKKKGIMQYLTETKNVG